MENANNTTYLALISMLEEIGYIVFEKDQEDFNISDYIADSMQFVQFILKIEEYYNIELSEDFLLYEILISAKGLANKIDAFIAECNDV